MGRLSVNLCGIELDNPVIPASGTFGFGYEFAELYDINCLGTFSFKATTKDARFGNPTPRIAECPSGMINAVGLQNPGVEKVISTELPKLKKCFNKPVMANVSGFSVEDYAYTCEKLDKEEQVGWLEVNVSCPNVHGGGMSFGTDPNAAAEVTRAVKNVTKKPVFGGCRFRFQRKHGQADADEAAQGRGAEYHYQRHGGGKQGFENTFSFHCLSSDTFINIFRRISPFP